ILLLHTAPAPTLFPYTTLFRSRFVRLVVANPWSPFSLNYRCGGSSVRRARAYRRRTGLGRSDAGIAVRSDGPGKRRKLNMVVAVAQPGDQVGADNQADCAPRPLAFAGFTKIN